MEATLALQIIGGLSKPSKMPCQGYSISAARCITGAKMAKVKNSICSLCYAMRGNYTFPVVKNAHEIRYQALRGPKWVQAMATAILKTEASGFFRWHDSGDLQGVWHLEKIVAVCKLTPSVKHWLPTREFSFVRQFLERGGKIPNNLTIRFSALMFDGPAPESLAKRCGVQVSGASQSAFTCPASSQGNKCLTCRACWNKKIFNVTYKKH